ncbi:hypothetical protein M0812_07029 [Anaeramoeba flamelloides]|uniref:Uncharacterized protein n=1 Tax=Anaeramoeba flamelloides TaxID=1746091 RepID=A0AAV8AAF4_9EUKA|nr:hypothetical protein M0812_07029 [Anaeramoeba flamelloides]
MIEITSPDLQNNLPPHYREETQNRTSRMGTRNKANPPKIRQEKRKSEITKNKKTKNLKHEQKFSNNKNTYHNQKTNSPNDQSLNEQSHCKFQNKTNKNNQETNFNWQTNIKRYGPIIEVIQNEDEEGDYEEQDLSDTIKIKPIWKSRLNERLPELILETNQNQKKKEKEKRTSTEIRKKAKSFFRILKLDQKESSHWNKQPKWPEPQKNPNKTDVINFEIALMAIDFKQERKLKISIAKILSYQAAKYVNLKRQAQTNNRPNTRHNSVTPRRKRQRNRSFQKSIKDIIETPTLNEHLVMEINIPQISNQNEHECKFLTSPNTILSYNVTDHNFQTKFQIIKNKQQNEIAKTLFGRNYQGTYQKRNISSKLSNNQTNNFPNHHTHYEQKNIRQKNEKLGNNNQRKIKEKEIEIEIEIEKEIKKEKNSKVSNSKVDNSSGLYNNIGEEIICFNNNNLNANENENGNGNEYEMENEKEKEIEFKYENNQMIIENDQNENETHLNHKVIKGKNFYENGDFDLGTNPTLNDENNQIIDEKEKIEKQKNKEYWKQWTNSVVQEKNNWKEVERKKVKNLNSIFFENYSLMSFYLNKQNSNVKNHKSKRDYLNYFTELKLTENEKKNENDLNKNKNVHQHKYNFHNNFNQNDGINFFSNINENNDFLNNNQILFDGFNTNNSNNNINTNGRNDNNNSSISQNNNEVNELNLINWEETIKINTNLTKQYQKKINGLKKFNITTLKNKPLQVEQPKWIETYLNGTNHKKKTNDPHQLSITSFNNFSRNKFNNSGNKIALNLNPNQNTPDQTIQNNNNTKNSNKADGNNMDQINKRIFSIEQIKLQSIISDFHLICWFLCKDLVNLTEQSLSIPFNKLFCNEKQSKDKKKDQEKNMAKDKDHKSKKKKKSNHFIRMKKKYNLIQRTKTENFKSVSPTIDDFASSHLFKFYLIIFLVKNCQPLLKEMLKISKRKILSQKKQVEEINQLIYIYKFPEHFIQQLRNLKIKQQQTNQYINQNLNQILRKRAYQKRDFQEKNTILNASADLKRRKKKLNK